MADGAWDPGTHQQKIVLRLWFPRSLLATWMRSLAERLNRRPMAQKPKTWMYQRRLSNKNAFRNVHSTMRRLNLLWDIPITKTQYHIHGAKDLTVHYIDPIDLLQFLLDTRPAILLGSLQDQQDQVHLLKSWWHAFRNDALNKTMPVFLVRRRGQKTLD